MALLERNGFEIDRSSLIGVSLFVDDFETFTFGFSHSMALYGFFSVGYKNIVYE